MAEPSEAPLHGSRRKRCGQSGGTTEETPRRHMTVVDDNAMAEVVEHVKMFLKMIAWMMMKASLVLHL